MRYNGEWLVCALVFVTLAPASASTIYFSGTFTQDDNQASFLVTLNTPRAVTIQTTSYANGGFAPVLSIFGNPLFAPGDPSLLGTNSGGSPCGVRGTNPSSGRCLDALLGNDSVLAADPLGTLPSGTYLVVLTEQANVPNGPDLAAGFAFDGQGNFTAIPGVNGGPFVDPSNPGITLTGAWALQFDNVDAAISEAVPESSTYISVLAGLGILVGARRRYAA